MQVEKKDAKTVLINISNHPSQKWSEEQRGAAFALADMVADILHPEVDPSAPFELVALQAQEFALTSVLPVVRGKTEVWLHLMGEYSFVSSLVDGLKILGLMGEYTDVQIHHILSTTQRTKVETIQADGSTKTEFVFKFVQFREVPW